MRKSLILLAFALIGPRTALAGASDAALHAGYCQAVLDDALAIGQSMKPPGASADKDWGEAIGAGQQLRAHFNQQLQASGALEDPAGKSAIEEAAGKGRIDVQHCLATSLRCAVQAGLPVPGGAAAKPGAAHLGREAALTVMACATTDPSCLKASSCALDGGLPLQSLLNRLPKN